MGEQLAEHDAVSREPVVASAIGLALLGVLLFVIFDRGTAMKPEAPASEMTASASMPATSETLIMTAAPANRGSCPLAARKSSANICSPINWSIWNWPGLILTVAMVGAIVIARKRVVGRTAFDESQPEMLTAAATPIDDNPHSIPVVGTMNPRQKEYPQT